MGDASSDDESEWSIIERSSSIASDQQSALSVESYAIVEVRSPPRAPVELVPNFQLKDAPQPQPESSFGVYDLVKTKTNCPVTYSNRDIYRYASVTAHSSGYAVESSHADVSGNYYLEYNSNKNRKFKYNETVKYNQMYGHSAVKRVLSHCSDLDTVDRSGGYQYSRRDKNQKNVFASCKLTDFDIDIQAVLHQPHGRQSLKKHSNYNAIEDRLKELACEIDERRNESYDCRYSANTKQITYTLPATAEIVNTEKPEYLNGVASKEQLVYHYPKHSLTYSGVSTRSSHQAKSQKHNKVLNIALYKDITDESTLIGYLQCIKLRRSASTTNSTGVSIQGKELRGKVSTNWKQLSRWNIKRCFVSENEHSCCWQAGQFHSETKQPYLEVDLGKDFVITAISTKGRHPRVEAFPDSGFWTRSGYRRRDYKGPLYDVIAGGDSKSPVSEAFVKKYRFSVRGDKCKQWVPLGQFEGNSDCFTEVAHQLHATRVVARYVRWLPLPLEEGGYVNEVAMRVGLYGHELSSGPEPVDSVPTRPERQYVSYTVTRANCTGNHTYANKSGNHRSYCNRSYSITAAKKNQHRAYVRSIIRSDVAL